MIKLKGMSYLAASIAACVSLSACSSAPTSGGTTQTAIAETQAAMRVELFQASLGRASVPGVGAEPVIGDKPQGEDTRERPRGEQQDLVVIPRGELASFAAQRTAEAPAPARASQIEAVVERIMNEISAGQRVGIQRGAGGALTVSFPMGQTALGISAIALTMTPDTLTVALSITGKGPEDSALRDLAQSLATRHPTKTVRIVREADEQGRSGGNA